VNAIALPKVIVIAVFDVFETTGFRRVIDRELVVVRRSERPNGLFIPLGALSGGHDIWSVPV